MTDNHQRTKEWLNLALTNINRVIGSYRQRDYSICIYFIQLSIEQLQKSLIFLLGLQFRKTHEPSKILESIETDKNIQIEFDILKKIKKIASISKEIESEGPSTRYGELIDGELLTPEKKYDKDNAKKFLNDLKEIIIQLLSLLENLPDFELEMKFLQKKNKKLGKLTKK